MRRLILLLALLLSARPLSAQITTTSGTGTTTLSGSGTTEIVSRWVLLFGDSKTEQGGIGGTTWPDPLRTQAYTATGARWQIVDVGVGGRTVATTLAAMAQMLTTIPLLPGAADVRVLVNLGVNDITTTLPADPGWSTNYLSILDQIHAQYPTARIYVTRPWIRTFDTDCDTVATRIAAIVAARSTFTVLGDDERGWYKAGDNGAANSSDGTHYSAAGNVAKVTATAAVLWP